MYSWTRKFLTGPNISKRFPIIPAGNTQQNLQIDRGYDSGVFSE